MVFVYTLLGRQENAAPEKSAGGGTSFEPANLGEAVFVLRHT
jgi:hypothetical protein